jgi:hypothetical protein
MRELNHPEVQKDLVETAREQQKIDSEVKGLKALETAQDCKVFVDDLYQKVNELINAEIFKIHIDQRWILRSRVINTLFASNYHPLIFSAMEKTQEAEKQLKTKEAMT